MMPKAGVNGISLYFEERGQGLPLVLSSGGMAGKLQGWKDSGVFDRFAERYRTIIYDRRGSGHSDGPIEAQSIEIWVEDLRGLLDHVDITSAAMLGSSQGAAIALAFAVAYPERTWALVLNRPTGGPELEEGLYKPGWEVSAEFAERFGMEAVVRAPGGPFFERILEDLEFAARLRQMSAAEYAALIRESIRRIFRGYPTVGASEEQLCALRVPTLILPGSDTFHPRSVGEAVHMLVPGSELRDVPSYREDAHAFVTAVCAFLEGAEANAGA